MGAFGTVVLTNWRANRTATTISAARLGAKTVARHRRSFKPVASRDQQQGGQRGKAGQTRTAGHMAPIGLYPPGNGPEAIAQPGQASHKQGRARRGV